MMKRSWFLRELERARLAQAKKRRRRASKPAKVTRATVWRRKRSLEEDKKVLQKIRYVYTQKPPGFLCHLCGQPRRMEFGHVTYKGKSFCSTASGQSAPDWLAEQKWVDGSCRGRNVPRTTAWNTQKRRQREQEAEEFGVRLKDRKRPGFHICNLCGQPRQKDFGHSRYKGVPFCSLYEGISVEEWLAKQRSADRKGRPVKSKSGRKKD
ncbi:hypothetical protein AMEX_G6129 [Astyanax mexicanus]|uniref:Uncharacterized protein n=1 Tax=Astyanax mexicanus TaxID=7994 RepID=A0A8T2M947_ASTMX|nr:hypothetical protein AMEX_G6129 [Astyanax mexicanus]